jgi:phosphomannomutase
MEKIGKAFADFIDGNKIAVGYDMRISSPQMFKAFTEGITSQEKMSLIWADKHANDLFCMQSS